MRFLGIDFGKKRVGIAISDEEGNFAFPKAVVSAGVKLSEEISELAKNNNVEMVIIGESKDFGGRENAIMNDVRVLIRQLEEKGLKVFLEAEYSSSFEAERFQGKNEMHDASAAAIILQRFLDKQKSLQEKKQNKE